MKVSIDMEVWFDGEDGYSVAAQIQAIKEMIQSGAESFNFDVHINNIKVAPEVEAPPAEWGSNCGSCKFLDTKDSRCTQRNIFVKLGSPKCPQWRYFA